MTPYELSVAIQVFNDKQKMNFENNLAVAFYGAWWQRVERLSNKDLKDVLDRLNGKGKEMTDEQMLERVKQLNVIFGGEIVKNE